MSDPINHECGIALIRLLKPLSYYRQKYGTWKYGLDKLYLLMEKQHNRGQDGAGIVCVKDHLKPGNSYINRYRSVATNPITDIFNRVGKPLKKAVTKGIDIEDCEWAYENYPFAGELYLGHLRYGTFGKNRIEYVHPVMRQNNWKSRNLVLTGNFNLTNTDELFEVLISLGQHPKAYTDTVTILEKVGHFLDEENQSLFRMYKDKGFKNYEISPLIEKNLDIKNILEKSSKDWDGGYAIAGIIGHGDAFVMRDPWGIRSAYYYNDEEIVVVASERAVIQTAMNVRCEQVNEVNPGGALIIKKRGEISCPIVRAPQIKSSCSFERIYFSRGSDAFIYRERKKLGRLISSHILAILDYNLDDTVFSFIPNTAEIAFYGMIEGIRDYFTEWKINRLHDCGKQLTKEEIGNIINIEPRIEKIAIKDVKLRTFITDDGSRNDLIEHVYDVAYGIIREEKDTLVIIDDSIVRGATLRNSILKILARLKPRVIVVVSSAPQIRYPDCYGIDMTQLGEFIAFNAAIELLKESGKENIISEVYRKCKEQENLPVEKMTNYVRDIYRPFSSGQISKKIAELLKPEECTAEVKIVFQSVENLHKACPDDTGDWYFTGNYPTPGGNRVVNSAFINYIEGKEGRPY